MRYSVIVHGDVDSARHHRGLIDQSIASIFTLKSSPPVTTSAVAERNEHLQRHRRRIPGKMEEALDGAKKKHRRVVESLGSSNSREAAPPSFC
jgi:hypothetical protein